MSEETLAAIRMVATVAAMFSIICRAATMSKKTPRRLRLKHEIMFGALAFSMSLPGNAGATVLAVGIMVVLVLGANDWRNIGYRVRSSRGAK